MKKTSFINYCQNAIRPGICLIAALFILAFPENTRAESTPSGIISTEDIARFETLLEKSTPEPDFSVQPKGNGLDQSEMIFIPAGKFIMGAEEDDSQAMAWEKPQHEVTLDAYWIDKYEVTNAQFANCVAAGYCVQPRQTGSKTRDSYYGNSEFADYPVIYVDWNQAAYYCSWVGKRLPTEAEWEKAARGTDGQTYPWGNTGEPAAYMNVNRLQDGDTQKIGSYPDGQSPYGLMDMGGNVWEWTADIFDRNYYADSPAENPSGGTEGLEHAVRGLSWAYGFPNQTITIRNKANTYAYTYDLGFRCALSAPETQ